MKDCLFIKTQSESIFFWRTPRSFLEALEALQRFRWIYKKPMVAISNRGKLSKRAQSPVSSVLFHNFSQCELESCHDEVSKESVMYVCHCISTTRALPERNICKTSGPPINLRKPRDCRMKAIDTTTRFSQFEMIDSHFCEELLRLTSRFLICLELVSLLIGLQLRFRTVVIQSTASRIAFFPLFCICEGCYELHDTSLSHIDNAVPLSSNSGLLCSTLGRKQNDRVQARLCSVLLNSAERCPAPPSMTVTKALVR